MPADTLDKPPPTPNPDQPCTSAPSGDRPPEVRPEQQPPDPEDLDEPVYDSCLDDLNVMLSQPVFEPDPALRSNSSTDDGSRSSREGGPVPSSRKDPGKQPRTSELFKALGPRAGEAASPETQADVALIAGPPGRESARPPGLARRGRPDKVKPGQATAADDDDQLGESRMTWFLLMLLSYASAVTLALVWLLWTGRTLRPAEPLTNDTRQASGESNPKSSEPTQSQPVPPIPSENLTTLDKPVQIGELEVTPLAIVSAPVELLRLIDEPAEYRREDTDSLVLRLRVTNLSKDHAFAPLDRDLIRGPISPLDRSQITSSNGRTISLFPLAVDSEWVIQGQQFIVLAPGETGETMVASEAVTDDRLTGQMTWRVRLRIGPYRTDVLAVRFTRDDVSL